ATTTAPQRVFALAAPNGVGRIAAHHPVVAVPGVDVVAPRIVRTTVGAAASQAAVDDVAAHGRAPVPRPCGPVLQQRAARRSAEAVRRSLTLFHIHRVPTQDDVTAGSTQDVIGAFATADEIVSIA